MIYSDDLLAESSSAKWISEEMVTSGSISAVMDCFEIPLPAFFALVSSRRRRPFSMACMIVSTMMRMALEASSFPGIG